MFRSIIAVAAALTVLLVVVPPAAASIVPGGLLSVAVSPLDLVPEDGSVSALLASLADSLSVPGLGFDPFTQTLLIPPSVDLASFPPVNWPLVVRRYDPDRGFSLSIDAVIVLDGDGIHAGVDDRGIALSRCPSWHPDDPTAVSRCGARLFDHGGLLALLLPDGRTFTFVSPNSPSIIAGRLVRVSDRYGRAMIAAHDPGGADSTVMDPSGHRFQVRREDGRIVVLGDVPGQWVTYELDASGRITEVLGPFGSSQFDYDASGRLWRQWDGDTVTEMNYDEVGRPVQVLGPAGTWSINWAEQGPGLVIVDPQRQKWVLQYGEGEPTWYRPDGTRVCRESLPCGGIVMSRIGPWGQDQFTLDSLGRLIRYQDRLGRITAWDYDGLSTHVIVRTSSDGSTAHYTRDARGRIAAVDCGSSRTGCEYDGLGRLVALADDGGNLTRWQYRGRQQVGRVLVPAGTVDFHYDLSGRLVTAGGITGSVTVSYGTDGLPVRLTGDDVAVVLAWRDGRLVNLTGTDGSSLCITWDLKGRVVGIADGDEQWGFVRDDGGRVVAVSAPGEQWWWLCRDGAGRTAQLAGPERLQLAWEPSGRHLSAMSADDGRWWKWQRDDLGQTLSVAAGGPKEAPSLEDRLAGTACDEYGTFDWTAVSHPPAAAGTADDSVGTPGTLPFADAVGSYRGTTRLDQAVGRRATPAADLSRLSPLVAVLGDRGLAELGAIAEAIAELSPIAVAPDHDLSIASLLETAHVLGGTMNRSSVTSPLAFQVPGLRPDPALP